MQMSHDTEKTRVSIILHLDDARMAIDSALELISDPATRAHLERAKRSLAHLEQLAVPGAAR